MQFLKNKEFLLYIIVSLFILIDDEEVNVQRNIGLGSRPISKALRSALLIAEIAIGFPARKHQSSL